MPDPTEPSAAAFRLRAEQLEIALSEIVRRSDRYLGYSPNWRVWRRAGVSLETAYALHHIVEDIRNIASDALQARDARLRDWP